MQCGTVDCLPGSVGSVVKPCAEMDGGLWVHVLDDLGSNVPGAKALKNGGDEQTTDVGGLARWDPLPAAQYVAKLAVSSEMAKEYDLPARLEEPVHVSKGQITYVGFELPRKMNQVKPTLAVDKQEIQMPFPDAKTVAEEIHTFQPKKPDKPDDPQLAEVTVSYTETLPAYAFDKGGTVAVTGVKATFWKDDKCQTPIVDNGGQLAVEHGDLKKGFKFYLRLEEAGDAQIALTLDNTTRDRAIVDQAALTKTVKVKPVNRVTPYLKVEHLVVLRDQELWKEQRKNDTDAGSAAAVAVDHIKPDPTRIELSAAKTADAPKYAGKGKLSFSAANVKVFEDEACEKVFDLSPGIEFDLLVADKPVVLWLQGATAGKFDAIFKLDASADATIKVDAEAKGEMGCVELKLNLYHYKKADIDQAVEPDVADVDTFWNQLKALTFEQKLMTPAERVGTGRLIHVQKDKNFVRVKLIAERVAAHWPAAAKDYKVVLDAADWDKKNKKRSGTLKLFDAAQDGAEITLPKMLTLDKADEKKEMWVEGATPCDGWRGIRISVGIDRDPAGPDKKAKLDGDWGVFTVVKIKEIKCDVANEAGQEKFVEGSKLFINLDDKGRLLKSVGGKRKAEITATIEPALKDLDIYFSIVEHADNYKIVKLPDDFKEKKISALKPTLKAIDKVDRKKLLHMSAKTDATGKAKIETLQAPQMGLMKFKVGAYLLQDPGQARYVEDHADLKLNAPTMSTDWLEVWRRTFFKVAAMKRWGGASYSDRFDGTSIVSKMESVGIEAKQVGAIVDQDYVTALPDALQWAKDALGGPAPSRTQYLCLINGRGDKGDLNKPKITLGPPTSKIQTYTLNKYYRFRDLADQAKWLVKCEVKYDGGTYNLATVTTLTQSGEFEFKIGIDFTARWDHYVATANQVKADDFLATGVVELTVKEADSSSGLSWGEAVVVCMDTREPSHHVQDAKGSASHTFLHEVGHYLSLTGKLMPDAANTLNPNFYSELVGEGNANAHGGGPGWGMGEHCDGLGGDCILWHQFKMTLEYCDTCKMFMRVRALHSPQVDARDAF